MLRPFPVRAAPEGTEVEDHDTGAGASAVGMSGASPAQSGGLQPARFSRHAGAHQRHADPRHAGSKHAGPKHAGQRQTGAGQADQHGDQPKGKTRKRRKRKRGRKVFARDENGAVPNAAPAST
ncbi:MAG: hypothetical protein E5V78_22120, partial [Mesorhizobium sp.]